MDMHSIPQPDPDDLTPLGAFLKGMEAARRIGPARLPQINEPYEGSPRKGPRRRAERRMGICQACNMCVKFYPDGNVICCPTCNWEYTTLTGQQTRQLAAFIWTNGTAHAWMFTFGPAGVCWYSKAAGYIRAIAPPPLEIIPDAGLNDVDWGAISPAA